MSLASLRGTWGYKAGSSGTPALPAGAQVLRILIASGTLTINGGDTITAPTGGLNMRFHHLLLVAPTLNFSAGYFVEYVVPS